jgi:aromatic ring-opening dioxygenase LigB subunit
MGKIISSYVFPHPPIIIPEVGKGNEEAADNTIKAVKRAAGDIKKDKPGTIIITTPHGPVFEDYIYMSVDGTLQGDLTQFGCSRVSLKFNNNNQLMEKIIEYAANIFTFFLI